MRNISICAALFLLGSVYGSVPVLATSPGSQCAWETQVEAMIHCYRNTFPDLTVYTMTDEERDIVVNKYTGERPQEITLVLYLFTSADPNSVMLIVADANSTIIRRGFFPTVAIPNLLSPTIEE